VSVYIVPQNRVPALLPMGECVDLMAKVLGTLARGDAVLPLRSILRAPGGSGVLGVMPAILGEPPCMGIKVISVFPGNKVPSSTRTRVRCFSSRRNTASWSR
jgi:ornithine cyclodeaminase